MNGQPCPTLPEASPHAPSNASADDRRTAQMRLLCHLLDVFASADAVMLAGAACYGDCLRNEGCDGEEVIQIAATALLVALEREIGQRQAVLDRLPGLWTVAPAALG